MASNESASEVAALWPVIVEVEDDDDAEVSKLRAGFVIASIELVVNKADQETRRSLGMELCLSQWLAPNRRGPGDRPQVSRLTIRLEQKANQCRVPARREVAACAAARLSREASP
jgi:hypothetical protein